MTAISTQYIQYVRMNDNNVRCDATIQTSDVQHLTSLTY
jgi:hypothetical protein